MEASIPTFVHTCNYTSILSEHILHAKDNLFIDFSNIRPQR